MARRRVPDVFRMNLMEGNWSIIAIFRGGPVRHKLSFSMTNFQSAEVLTWPSDRDKMLSVLPEEFIPQFILDLYHQEFNPNQKELP